MKMMKPLFFALGLVAISLGLAPAAGAHDLNDKAVFLGWLKLTAPADLGPYVDQYENLFVRFSDRIPRDEFHDRVKQYEAMLQKAIDGFDPKEGYVATSLSQVGDYDTATGQFDFKPLQANSVISVAGINVVFLNTLDFDGLKVAPDLAQTIATKDYRGVEIKVYLTPVSVSEEARKIRTKIEKIEVFRKEGIEAGEDPIAVMKAAS